MNKTHSRIIVPVLLLLCAMGLMLSGCGSGSKTISTAVLSADTRKAGAVVLNIVWPTQAAKARVIPTASTNLVLVVTAQTGVFTDTKTNTKTVSVTYGTPTITVTGVPAGSCLVQCFALLENANGTQVVLATLNNPLQVNVIGGQNNPITLTLQATLTTATTTIAAFIQKVLNADGSAVPSTDPMSQPQALSATTTLQNLTDGAVYYVTSTISTASGAVPLPAASEFTFTIVDNTSYTAPFLTAVDSKGVTLTSAAVGSSAYFKVNAAGSNGNVVITLNSPFTDPSLTPVSTAFPLSAPLPLLQRLTGRGAFQVRAQGTNYFYLIENNFAGGNLSPRILVPPYQSNGAAGQLYNTLNPEYDKTGRWLVFSAIQQVGSAPDPAVQDAYGIILIDTKATTITPINLTAPLQQFHRARCQDAHWSPDGTKIIFQDNTNAGVYTLHVLNVDFSTPTPTAVEDPNTPTSLHGADPLLLADGSIIYVNVNTPKVLEHYTAANGSVPLQLPVDTNGVPFTSSYYANTFGIGLVMTVNHGDGTSDQLATYNLSTNLPTLLEPAINTATNNSDPNDAGNGLLLFSRSASVYHLFVGLPGSTLAPQEIDFTNIPSTTDIIGAAYTP